jgi:hypothetical protein
VTPKAQSLWLAGFLAAALAPRPVQRPSEWCEQNVVFNEPNCRGPFSFAGREYLREPLDWYGLNDTDMVICAGTRTGKTRILFGGKAWMLVHEPRRMLCVMPNTHGTGGAQNVSRTRWRPTLLATRATAALVPTGRRRHEFKSLQQILGGSIVDWVGSNSPANLASNPASYVEQDEVDKYKRLGEREADPVKLADERCKEFSNPKRVKTSTPTLVSGTIWQELMKSDLRRYFMPCPHCAKHVVFAWNEQFTVLPHTGCEAYVKWDAAKVDSEWDLDRVQATARAECPHCQGAITDNDKQQMIRLGSWRPTRTGSPGYRGYHLPSMYSTHVETSFGRLAVKFLTGKASLSGLQGFINSDLAEPYQAQDTLGQRIERISKAVSITAEWCKFLTVDCQARAPYFWYVARAWNGSDSEGIETGSCDTWDELRALQGRHGVQDAAVLVDSGFGARSNVEVYEQCARWSAMEARPYPQLPLMLGWMPTKGFESQKVWKDEQGLTVPYGLRGIDPFLGKRTAGQVEMLLLEFDSGFFQDLLEKIRNKSSTVKFSIPEAMATQVYFRHMDGAVKREIVNKMTGRMEYRWVSRARYWPDHIRDCEKLQLVAAVFHRRLPL